MSANSLMRRERSQLILVDYQSRLLPALFDGERVVAQAVLLAEIANVLGVPVIGTAENPESLGPNVEAIRSRCRTVLSKRHFDACADGLLLELGAPADSEIVIAGCEAHVCLLQTALGLLAAGFTVRVVADACASRLARNHEIAMQRLRDAGALVVSVEMVAFEWLRSCEDERFRQVLALLKAAGRRVD